MEAFAQPEPLQVVSDFVSAVDSGRVRPALADDCILSFFGWEFRGPIAVATYLRDISTGWRHTGFDKAVEVRPGAEIILKERYGRSFHSRLYELKEPDLRLEADCEVQASPPRPAGFDRDQVKYVEASGSLVGESIKLLFCGKLHLTLGYRQTLCHSQKRRLEICLAVYEKYQVPLESKVWFQAGSSLKSSEFDELEREEIPAVGKQLSELKIIDEGEVESQEDETPGMVS